MTTTIAPVAVSRPRSSRGWSGPLSDVWAMTRRALVHISREPMQLSDVTLQPALFTFLPGISARKFSVNESSFAMCHSGAPTGSRLWRARWQAPRSGGEPGIHNPGQWL